MSEFAGVRFIGPCKSRWGDFDKRYVVWHNTSNDATPEDEARYAMRRTDKIGLHFAVDPTTVVQCLETNRATGHVGSITGNRHGISVEITGFNHSSAEYFTACIIRCASVVADVCRKWRIPPRWLTIDQMRDGVSRGHVTHDMARIAWGGTTHTDPGLNFPSAFVTSRLSSILTGPPPAGSVTHRPGSRLLRLDSPMMRGSDVRHVQTFIGPARCGAADGIFGTRTHHGVRWYQKMRGIRVDGIVGPVTWAHMAVRWIG